MRKFEGIFPNCINGDATLAVRTSTICSDFPQAIARYLTTKSQLASNQLVSELEVLLQEHDTKLKE